MNYFLGKVIGRIGSRKIINGSYFLIDILIFWAFYVLDILIKLVVFII